MVLFQQASCNNSFSYSYFHRIICMVIAFSLLVLLCCNTCVIFRRRKNILEERYAPNNARASPYLINDPLSNARLQGNHL